MIYATLKTLHVLSIVVWIIRSYMIDIPHEIEDAARTDGASDLRILWSIIIPMCLPGIITAGGIAATNIAKWNGSSWSAVGSGMNGAV